MRGSCYLDHDTGDVSVYVFDPHGQKPWAEYTAIKGPTDGIPTPVFNHVSGTYEPSLTLRVYEDRCTLYKTISQDFETGVIDQRALDVYFLVPFFESALRGGAKPNVSPRQYMQAPNP